MNGFLPGILVDIFSGSANRRLTAAEAFESAPGNRRARRYRIAAFWLFMATSALLLTAAIVHTYVGNPSLGEVFGWTGIVCFELCVLCGLRYAVVNRSGKES